MVRIRPASRYCAKLPPIDVAIYEDGVSTDWLTAIQVIRSVVESQFLLERASANLYKAGRLRIKAVTEGRVHNQFG